MPLLDSIDDPKGIVHVMPEHASESELSEYFVKRVQEIRRELFGLLHQLDDIEEPTEAATMLIPHAIDLLGAVARAEHGSTILSPTLGLVFSIRGTMRTTDPHMRSRLVTRRATISRPARV